MEQEENKHNQISRGEVKDGRDTKTTTKQKVVT